MVLKSCAVHMGVFDACLLPDGNFRRPSERHMLATLETNSSRDWRRPVCIAVGFCPTLLDPHVGDLQRISWPHLRSHFGSPAPKVASEALPRIVSSSPVGICTAK